MEKTPKEWLEEAINKGHINNLAFHKFTDSEMIAIGGFGKVYKYEWKDCDLTVALKCLKIDADILDEKIVDAFINELKLLRKVDYHPNIIKFYGVTKDNGGYYSMVLQYANDGNLREYLITNFTRLQWAEKLFIAKEVTRGLLFLHDNNIIHRDLHSKNILIHQRRPKIADFGLSRHMNEVYMTSNSSVRGMTAYVDPQCLFEIGYERNKKSDIGIRRD